MSHLSASRSPVKRQGMTHPTAQTRSADLHLQAWLRPGPSSYLHAYHASGPDLVEAVKIGLPAGMVDTLAQGMHLPKEQLMATLGLARATIQRKLAQRRPLSADESSRVLGMARLIGQVQAMVDESGDPLGFDAAGWVGTWLQTPAPALGGRRPAEYMDTAEGQSVVSRLLSQSQSGAYA